MPIVVEKSIEIKAPPEKVWELVSSVERLPSGCHCGQHILRALTHRVWVLLVSVRPRTRKWVGP